MADDDATFGTRDAPPGTGDGGGTGSARTGGARLREHGEDIRRDGEALARHLGELIGDLEDEWGERAVRQPYAVIGACFALGYVLGGGLPSGFVRFAAGMASRMAITSVARSALSTAAERS